jgi:dolichol kinase
VSPEAVASLARIAGSVALLAVVLWGVARLGRLARLDAELCRKLIHVSLGLYCLSFPWVFEEAWEVAATCALAAGLFALARGAMRRSLGEGLHRVGRSSYGELLFAASVALLFWLMNGHYIMVEEQDKPPLGAVLYVLPLLILTLSDAASALVGSAYGRQRFRVEEGDKSWEGVVAFAVTAWLAAMICLLLLTSIGRAEVILLALIVAVWGALIEASSWRGLDNLFIPLGIYFLVANLYHLGVYGLAGVSAIFLLLLLSLAFLAARSGSDRHFLAFAALLFFTIAIFSGVESLLTPALVVGAYLLSARFLPADRPRHDQLSLMTAVTAICLCFFVISNLLRVDTIFGFNLAFAALAAGVVARFGAAAPVVVAAGALAWCAMSVRTLLIEGARPETVAFSVAAAAAIAAVAWTGWRYRLQRFRRPWMTLGGLSLAAGLATFPAWPR